MMPVKLSVSILCMRIIVVRAELTRVPAGTGSRPYQPGHTAYPW